MSASALRTDHLRVCGADRIPNPPRRPRQGSSPRVRSRRVASAITRPSQGIISACAEQTISPWDGLGAYTDHLRVCGADTDSYGCEWHVTGSSPRVRSRPAFWLAVRRSHGIISACAEQTCGRRSAGYPTKDHLRVCGADLHRTSPTRSESGSSPRVRSRPLRTQNCSLPLRIISACAEQTMYRCR